MQTRSNPSEPADTRAEQRLAALLNSLDGIVWECDPRTMEFLFVSEQAEKLLGYPLSSWYEDKLFWLSIIHPEDREWVPQFCKDRTKRLENHAMDYRMITADGRQLWVRDLVSVIPEDEGSFRLTGVIFDVTEQKRNEQRLLEHQKLFRAFMDNTPAVTFMKDHEGRYQFVNRTYERLFSEQLGEAVGRTDHEIMPAEVADALVRNDEVVRSTRHICEFIEHVPVSDGHQRDWLVLKFPYEIEPGLICIGGVAVDLTDRRRAEENAAQLTVMEQREEFMAMLTHDLKNPVIGADRILDFLTNPETRLSADEQRDLLLKLKTSNSQLLRLIKDVLEVLRSEREPYLTEARPTNISSVARSCADQARPSAQDKEIVLRVEGADEPVMAVVVEPSIKRVITNLLSNAIKFTPAKGTVRLTQSVVGDMVVLTVADNGPGVAPEEEGRLFSKFWQSKHGRRFEAGTGLGLYICKQIVSGHGGQISYERNAAGGATFTVMLPQRMLDWASGVTSPAPA